MAPPEMRCRLVKSLERASTSSTVCPFQIIFKAFRVQGVGPMMLQLAVDAFCSHNFVDAVGFYMLHVAITGIEKVPGPHKIENFWQSMLEFPATAPETPWGTPYVPYPPGAILCTVFLCRECTYDQTGHVLSTGNRSVFIAVSVFLPAAFTRLFIHVVSSTRNEVSSILVLAEAQHVRRCSSRRIANAPAHRKPHCAPAWHDSTGASCARA